MRWLSSAVTAIAGYPAHPDPRAALANTVALVIVSNQPFYPPTSMARCLRSLRPRS